MDIKDTLEKYVMQLKNNPAQEYSHLDKYLSQSTLIY